MSLYLIQSEPSPLLQLPGVPSSEAMSVVENVELHNWLHPDNKSKCLCSSLENLPTISPEILSECIPIGSIEFVEKVLQLGHNIPQLTPIIIPEALLNRPEWLSRRIAFSDDIDYAKELFVRWDIDRIFLKSSSRVKSDFTGIYAKNEKLPKTCDSIMFSEVVELQSEWRAFVFRESLVDIRYYMGDPWVMPNRKTIMEMIAAIGQTYPAYTLDIAVSKDNQTIVVEVHNFISCGLYGAEPILGMYTAAYRHEIRSFQSRV